MPDNQGELMSSTHVFAGRAWIRPLAAVAALAAIAGLCLSVSPARASTVASTAIGAAAPAGTGHDFGTFSAAEYLTCTGGVTALGQFGLNVTGVTTSFKKWTKTDESKKFSASVGWSTTISATLGASKKTTCTPGKALKKISATFTINGAKVTLSPDFEFNVNKGSAISVSQTTKQSLTISGKIGLALPGATYSITPGKPNVTSGGAASFDALIGADANINAGVVDLDLGLMAGLHAAATAKSDPAGICVSGYPELQGTGQIGVTLLDWHKNAKFLNHRWTIKSVDGHATTFDQCTYTESDD